MHKAKNILFFLKKKNEMAQGRELILLSSNICKILRLQNYLGG